MHNGGHSIGVGPQLFLCRVMAYMYIMWAELGVSNFIKLCSHWRQQVLNMIFKRSMHFYTPPEHKVFALF